MVQSYGITSNKRRGVYKFFKFLEAIYSRKVFNRRCFTISHDQPNLNQKKHNLKEQIDI